MDADGKNITQLTQIRSNGYPSWSPDGQRIAFASDRDGENFHFQIYVMDADGKNINPTHTKRQQLRYGVVARRPTHRIRVQPRRRLEYLCHGS